MTNEGHYMNVESSQVSDKGNPSRRSLAAKLLIGTLAVSAVLALGTVINSAVRNATLPAVDMPTVQHMEPRAGKKVSKTGSIRDVTNPKPPTKDDDDDSSPPGVDVASASGVTAASAAGAPRELRRLVEVTRLVLDPAAAAIRTVTSDPKIQPNLILSQEFSNWWDFYSENVGPLSSEIERIGVRAIVLGARNATVKPAQYRAIMAALETLYNDHSDKPYGPCSATVYYRHPRTRRHMAMLAAVNGFVFIDLEKLNSSAHAGTGGYKVTDRRTKLIKLAYKYDDAVKLGIVTGFIKSTWNTWHEATVKGNYLYAIQESIPVGMGLEIIKIDGDKPVRVTSPELTSSDKGRHGKDSPLYGGHYINAETTRDIVWVNGAFTKAKREYMQSPWDDKCPKQPVKLPGAGILIPYDVSVAGKITELSYWDDVYVHGTFVQPQKNGKLFIWLANIYNRQLGVLDATNVRSLQNAKYLSSVCQRTARKENYYTHSVTFDTTGEWLYLTGEEYGNPLHVYRVRGGDKLELMPSKSIFNSFNGTNLIFHEGRMQFSGNKKRMWMSAFESGTFVFDVSDGPNPRVIAHLDHTTTTDKRFGLEREAATFPDSNFNGAWSSWPIADTDYGIASHLGTYAGDFSYELTSGKEDPGLVLMKLQ